MQAVSTFLAKTQRATASLLLLVMFVPGSAPLLLSQVSPYQGIHCKRPALVPEKVVVEKQVPQPPHAERPAMHCHHDGSQSTEAQAAQPATALDRSADEFSSGDCCCSQNCDCCRNAKVSLWLRLVPTRSVFVSFVFETFFPAPIGLSISASLVGPDSARAPPRV